MDTPTTNDSRFTSLGLPQDVQRGSTRKRRSHFSMRTYQPKSSSGPIRTPLPILEEAPFNDDEANNSVWEAPSTSLHNVHRPQRKASIKTSANVLALLATKLDLDGGDKPSSLNEEEHVDSPMCNVQQLHKYLAGITTYYYFSLLSNQSRERSCALLSFSGTRHPVMGGMAAEAWSDE